MLMSSRLRLSALLISVTLAAPILAQQPPTAQAQQPAAAETKRPAIGETITTPSGLKYYFSKIGKGPQAQAGDMIVMHGIGKFPDGKEFWNTHTDGGPFEYALGRDSVIKGFAEGMREVHEGDRVIMTMPPDIAYGARGNADIPPNSTLVFDYEILIVRALSIDRLVRDGITAGTSLDEILSKARALSNLKDYYASPANIQRLATTANRRQAGDGEKMLAFGLTLLPKAYQLHQSLARWQIRRHDTAAAITNYEAALALNPDKTPAEISDLTAMTNALADAKRPQQLTADAAARFAKLALACVHQEYPNKITHILNSAADAKQPHELTPAFYGCYDWHSAVHGHWLLARLVRQFPDAPFAREAIAALIASITPANIAGEVAYFNGKGRETFERPYGLAWLLQLSAELREWTTPEGRALAAAIAPLEATAVARINAWLPKLAYPIREGEHPQTAFAFGLILDWARAYNPALAKALDARIREFHLKDRGCALNYEPSGQDFVSPCLAEADLMRRILPAPEFATWLSGFLPAIPRDGSTAWLAIGVVTDKTDGKLAHLDGLNLSRAWMLEGIASGLPPADPRRRALAATANVHAASGLAAVTGDSYEGGHWLGSFGTYLLTTRGR